MHSNHAYLKQSIAYSWIRSVPKEVRRDNNAFRYLIYRDELCQNLIFLGDYTNPVALNKDGHLSVRTSFEDGSMVTVNTATGTFLIHWKKPKPKQAVSKHRRVTGDTDDHLA